jgi:hypothetical protein
MLNSFVDLLHIDFSGYNNLILIIGGYTNKVILPSIELLTIVNTYRILGEISNTLVLCIDPQYSNKYLDSFLNITSVAQ